MGTAPASIKICNVKKKYIASDSMTRQRRRLGLAAGPGSARTTSAACQSLHEIAAFSK